MASKKLINISNLQKFLSKLNEKFALKKTMKGISEDAEGNIIIGEEGLVPTPDENSKGKFLRSDGEWALPSETAVYDSMTIEEGVAGVSEVDKVLNAKNLKQIVNSDGFLTSLDSSKLTGIINIENLPQGALERILMVSSKEERLTLLDTEVQLGDVVKESDTGLMYYVINTEKLNSEEGYTQFTAGTASSVPWSGVTDKPLIPTKTSELMNDSDFAIDSDVVHTSGREVIGGDKVFQNTIYRESDITTSTVEEVYRLSDTNATPCGSIYNRMHWYNNNIYNRHQAYNATSGKDMYVEVLSGNDGSGVINTGGSVTNNKNLTTVTNATGSSYVATMGWVNNPATSTNVVHRSGNETIAGTKTFSDKTISRNELHYVDIKYDWSDTSLDTWCNAGNVAWFDKTGNRRMHELVGANNGVWKKSCFINENQYFSVDSNKNISFWGGTTFFDHVTFDHVVYSKNNFADLTITPTEYHENHNYVFMDKNNVPMGHIEYCQRPTGVNDIGIFARDKNGVAHGIHINTNNEVIPLMSSSETYSLGSSSHKWTNAHITYTYTNRVTTYSIAHPTDDSYFFVSGGTDYNKGATLYLGGVSATNFTPGRFALSARKTDGSSIELAGSPDGTLKWNGSNVAREDNLCSMFANAIRFGGVGCIKLLAFEWDGYNTNAFSLREGETYAGAYLRHVVMNVSGATTMPDGSDTVSRGGAGYYLGTRPTGTWSLLCSFNAFNRSIHPYTCVGLFVRIA